MVKRVKIMNKTMVFSFLLGLFFTMGCEAGAQEKTVLDKENLSKSAAKITFIELGSVNCIPCRAMQPVMRAIESRYGDQINVVFYDVWTPEQNHYARDYGIRVIPTQIYLDSTGTEILRHEGFFPEKEIIGFLDSKGLEPVTDD
ncbi:thioredoxin family protein [Candidatus Neomarinimicrobiota bacterium]